MNLKSLQFVIAGIFAILLALSTGNRAFGQGVTTGGMGGFVTDAQGNPVAGATVSALHVPSGTRSATVTRSNGEYNLDGLRPGGPYTVSVSGTGFIESEQTGYMVDVGARLSVNFSVSNEVIKMSAVTVAESRDTTFDTGQMGTGLYVNGPDIKNIASNRGDISDLMNLDPRATVMQAGTSDPEYTVSIQGQNPKENLILVDGVSATDNFGLNSNSYAGLRNPIPFPWIENFAVLINDYDIVYSGFEGGAIDITLKSGTNDFHGSIYEQYAGTKFRGPDPIYVPGVSLFSAHEPQNVHTSGLTFGGPIIKNKLFFFVGYEAFREISAPPAQEFIITDPRLSAILAKAESYGYDPGTGNAVSHSWEQNFVTKLDWNISDTQKFEFTFRHTAGALPNFYDYSSGAQTSLSSSWYNSFRTDQSYSLKFLSDWSHFIPGLRSEIEATYKRYDGTATLSGQDFPSIQIYNVAGTSVVGATPAGNANLFLGTYYAYQLNNIYTWEQEEHAYGEYSVGNHTFKFGAQFDRTGYTDTFVPNYLGTYYFSNVQDFLNGTPTGVTLETPNAGYTLGDSVSHYYLLDIAPLLQDTWTPNSRLTVTGGLRMDYPYIPQTPLPSQAFISGFGYSNATTMNGNYTISPRLGFNYNLPTKRKTQIRGGGGLFLGQNPVVWVENAYSSNGSLNSYNISNSTVPIANYTFTGNPATQPLPPVSAGSAAPSIDTVSPSFHWPANWKENIAIDHELPFWHLIFTAEADFSQVEEDVQTQQINLRQGGATKQNGITGTQPVYLPDGALRYAGNITPGNLGTAYFAPGYTTANFYTSASSQSSSLLENTTKTSQVYELENTDKGGSQEYTLVLGRPMLDNWSISVAYTHTHATQVEMDASSTASSNYFDKYFINPTDNVPYRSQFAVPDKFIVNGSMRFHFFPWHDTSTTISAQFITQTGQAFSYVFKGDADGSGLGNQSLFYVPTGPSDPKVAWASASEEAAFFQWLANTPGLAAYAGKIAPRNEFYAPWQETLNLHFEQALPIYRPARLVLFADCYNFANLVNKNWGIVDDYNADFGVRTVAGTGYNPAGNNGRGQYVYVFNSATLGQPVIYSDMSRWALTIGARIEF